MSVTSAAGFVAQGVAAGIKTSGHRDVAIVVNNGPQFHAAGVFTSNRIKAAPVLWSEEVLKSKCLKAIVLNSGGANACTGSAGFADTHRTAEFVSEKLGLGAIEVAVCSTGLIGERLPMEKLLHGAEVAIETLSSEGGFAAAQAIMTTDSVAKVSVAERNGWTVGGMAKGAGMLAPGLATMLVVLTTDVDATSIDLQSELRHAVEHTFNRIDSDGCMSTNDTVLILASGASGMTPELLDFRAALMEVCQDLARQLIADAEGATKDIRIDVLEAATEQDALKVAREVGRSNLLKCAIHGEDPNWGRVLAALGTTDAVFDPLRIDVALNQVWVCKDSQAAASRDQVDMSDREVVIAINLHAGLASASVWTNDLTAMYVHENSAYSS